MNPSNSLSITLTAQWSLVNYVKTFSYTGSAQTWTVPYTGNYKVELWGAQGGPNTTAVPRTGGAGGYVAGTITISASSSIYCYIGKQGASATKTSTWNGGGASGDGVAAGQGGGGQGGGATDCRTVSGAWNNASSLRSRIIVAAGGGGAGSNYSSHSEWNGKISNGGYGGGLTGGPGIYESAYATSYTPPTGANQTATGTPGEGNYQSNACTSNSGGFGYGGSVNTSCYYGGGGGGGWYGGTSGGTKSMSICSGSGGSSYISGHTGSVAVASTSSSSPKSGCTTGTTTNSCSISPYGYTFTNTNMVDGQGYKWTNTKGSKTNMPTTSGSGTETGHSGNGYAKITWLGT